MPKDNKNNKSYSKEQKEAMTAKLLPPNNMSVMELSKQSGIPQTTLYGWRSRAIKRTDTPKDVGTTRKPTSAKDKLHVIMETYTLSEHDLGKYCRENGLYVDRVKKWRLDFEASLDKESNAVKEIKKELFEEKKKIEHLQKELNRKDKALAEAASLLVLQKKFQALMEEKED